MKVLLLSCCAMLLFAAGCVPKETDAVDYSNTPGNVVSVRTPGDVSMFTYPPKMEGLSKYYVDETTLKETLATMVKEGRLNLAAFVARYAPEKYDSIVAGWIQSNLSELPPPFYYVMAQKTAATDSDEALKWMVRGWGAAVLDAKMCRDKSAGQGVRYLSSLLSEKTRTLINTDKQTLWNAQMESVEFMASHKTNYTPMWICSHGISSFSGEGNTGFEPPEKRVEELEKYRQVLLDKKPE